MNAATSDKESKPGGHPNFIFKKAEEIDALVPMIAIGGIRVAAESRVGPDAGGRGDCSQGIESGRLSESIFKRAEVIGAS